MEDPTTGKLIPAPLIIGDALLHTPHLGEAAALYSIEKELSMTNETVTVSASWFEKLVERFTSHTETPPPQEPQHSEDFTALQTKFEAQAAEITALKAEQTRATQLSAIRADFQTETFGAAFQTLGTDANVTMLASMTEEQRAWVTTQLKALSAQVKESNLTGKLGKHTETETDPMTAFNAAIVAEMETSRADYATAALSVARKSPDVYAAYMQARGGK